MMKHIILIGFMGCGKSSIGYRLSYKLRKCLIDTDRLIEQREGMSIAEIFDQKGEAYFRQKETDCLKSLANELGSRVVSVGGGTPIREENQDILKSSGTVVYLKASPETIYSRVKHDTRRPLLQCEDPKSRIEALLKERGPIYESVADIIIEVDGKHIKQVVQEVAEAVQGEDFGN
jgi:shikimate kinase